MEVYILEAHSYFNCIRNKINLYCVSYDAFLLVLITFIATWTVAYVWNWFTAPSDKGYKQLISEWIFLQIRRIPYVRNRYNKEMAGVVHSLETQLVEDLKGRKHILELPQQGLSKESVIEEVDNYLNMSQIDYEKGQVSGAVYKKQDIVLEELVTLTYGKMAYANPLHPEIFPGLRKMEAEIVRMTINMYKGTNDHCGAVTTGGTESIFLACKAYRDYAKAVKGISHPEMVVPVTAHAAFDKSAQILKIRIKHVPVLSETMQVDLKAMRRSITKNTCMLVGSTPQYPHGIVDPIADIAQLGLKYNIPVHMDACLGGFLVPFVQLAGFDFPVCNFTVNGITSISADTHKYGYAPKGTSVIMYSDTKYRHYQYSAQSDWPGGIYATPTLGGSRAGGTIGGCWATLMYFGQQGYIESTKKIISTTRYIDKRLREIDGIFIYGKPQASVIAIGSKEFDIYRLSQALTHLKWTLNMLQFPDGFHLCITQLHTQEGVADRFIEDVRKCTETIMLDPNIPASGSAAIYGTIQSIPDRKLVIDGCWAFVDNLYSTKNIS